ncbi:Class III cytochrome C family protein [Maridesulfovibrio ferrireducens]|uniref:Class III cytochrome C family protein n=1 Tax=Maridesulfovibrio ferrireducens TaxID=246191 RepID=A0A1G9I014_9BACT|nr:cytochrome c3 family protein [Maridesulfovibrio ferrireducens]SDL18559.1 Class III cytochrome C family protein [Maridesulfovibrio ferrireducens]
MKNLFIVCLLCIGMTVLTIAANADDKAGFEAPEDEIMINFIKGNSKDDLGVAFNHSSHENYECVDCHHALRKTKVPTSCATCHNNFEPVPAKGYKSYFKAMHIKRNNDKRPSCVSCHIKEFGNDPSMTGCTASSCHPDGIK